MAQYEDPEMELYDNDQIAVGVPPIETHDQEPGFGPLIG